MADVVLYLDVDAGADAPESEFVHAVTALPEVSAVDVEVEDAEKSAAEVLDSLTVTITAAGGVVGATSLLVANLTTLLEKVHGLRRAWVGTPDGPRELELPAGKARSSGHGPR